MMPKTRIDHRFAALRGENRGGLVVFVTAGDPDPLTSAEILLGLPGAGADFIELGMPFSDPMADGPAIQKSSQRALKSGATMKTTLKLVTDFRARDDETPIILMGYYNPVYIFGVDAFLSEAKAAGIDGLISVDLPPEEENEICLPSQMAGISPIYLTAPTTDEVRLPKVVKNASGFVYYVSITGITGTASARIEDIREAIKRLHRHTGLPIAVGFGIKTPEQAAEVAAVADAAVVGSALVGKITENLDEDGKARPGLADAVLDFTAELAKGVRDARIKGAS